MKLKKRRLPFRYGFMAYLARTGTSQVEIAKRIGATQGTINHWVTGVTEPNYKWLVKLLDLGMTIPEMFQFDLVED